jgi:hypothetical protein
MTSEISKSDYIALKKEKLEHPQTLPSAQNLLKLTKEYNASVILDKPLKVFEIYKFRIQLQEKEFVIDFLFGEDESIRLVNQTFGRQCIYHRYALALKLKQENMINIFSLQDYQLLITPIAKVILNKQGTTIADIDGMKIISLNQNIQQYNFLSQNYKRCTDKEVFSFSENIDNTATPQPELLPSFNRQRSLTPLPRNQSENVTTRSTSLPKDTPSTALEGKKAARKQN